MTQADRSQQCPLCEADNACAVAAGEALEGCWCRAATFDPASLAAIPAAGRGVRCLCQRCATTPAPEPSAEE